MIDRIATVNKQSYRNKVNKSINAMFTSVFVPAIARCLGMLSLAFIFQLSITQIRVVK